MVPRVVEHAVAESHHVVVGHRGVAVTADAMYLPIRGLYDSDPGTWPTRLLDRNRRRRRVGGDGVHGAAYRCSTGCNTGLATDRPLVLYSYVRWPSRGRAWMLLRECGGGEDTTSTTELSPHRQAEEPETRATIPWRRHGYAFPSSVSIFPGFISLAFIHLHTSPSDQCLAISDASFLLQTATLDTCRRPTAHLASLMTRLMNALRIRFSL